MKNKFLIFILYIASVFALTAGNIEDANSIDVQVVFQKISHQNPWIVGEPFSKRGKAIHVGKGLFFTVTLSQQKPLFAEFDSLDFSTPKLKVEAYDPETGFTLLQAFEGEKLVKAVSLEEKSIKKLCPTGKSRYVQLPFSKTPIKTYLLEKKKEKIPIFLSANLRYVVSLILIF